MLLSWVTGAEFLPAAERVLRRGHVLPGDRGTHVPGQEALPISGAGLGGAGGPRRPEAGQEQEPPQGTLHRAGGHPPCQRTLPAGLAISGYVVYLHLYNNQTKQYLYNIKIYCEGSTKIFFSFTAISHFQSINIVIPQLTTHTRLHLKMSNTSGFTVRNLFTLLHYNNNKIVRL